MARSSRRRPPRPGALTELPPLKILFQIAVLQVIYYVSGTALVLFAAVVQGSKFGADMVLNWGSLRGDTTVGWMLGVVWMCNSFVGAVALVILISRSKLIPDFALTLHFLHLIVVSLYSKSIPQNLLWWILQVCSAAFMTALAMYACQWRELRPINFGGGSAAAAGTGSISANANAPTEDDRLGGDEEMGYGRRARGRGRDAAGEYEMVGMKAEGET